MATTKGPIKGTRIPVKLPWKGATDNEEQFVSMKQPVADFLNFSSASTSDLEYEVQVQKKDGKDGKVTGTTTVKRRRRPGYRQRSIRVEFGVDSSGKEITKKVGGKTIRSLQFPITKSVAIREVIEYFESGNGKSLGVQRVVDANSGQGYAIIQ